MIFKSPAMRLSIMLVLLIVNLLFLANTLGFVPSESEAALDRSLWGQYGESQTLEQAVGILENDYLHRRRVHLYTTHGACCIPGSQSPFPPVVISEIMYDPPEGAGAGRHGQERENASGRPPISQRRETRRPVPDRVTKAVCRLGPPKQMLVVSGSSKGT